MKLKRKNFVGSVITFFLLSAIYELCVFIWASNVPGPIIRVDVVVVYPVIFLVSVILYFLMRK